MRKHYTIELLLLCAIAISGGMLAADDRFYEIFLRHNSTELINIDDTLLLFKKSVSYIRFSALFTLIISSAYSVSKFLQGENKIIAALTRSVHETIFRNVDKATLTDTKQKSIYRVTCYKIHKPGLFVSIISLLFYLSALIGIAVFSWQWLSLSSILSSTSLTPWIKLLWVLGVSVVGFIVIFIIHKFFSYVVIPTYTKEWLKRKRTRDKRKMIWGEKYLLAASRYGNKDGLPISNESTSLAIRVKKDTHDIRPSHLFAGKVYDTEHPVNYAHSLNKHNVSETAKKIISNKTKQTDFTLILDDTIDKNIEAIKQEINTINGTITPKVIDDTETLNIATFMKETNTMAFHIVDINAGTHCNHFVGFKIFAGKEKNSTNIWGIVNIDILDVANKDFYAILGQSNDEKWLNNLLSSLSDTFTNTINSIS